MTHVEVQKFNNSDRNQLPFVDPFARRYEAVKQRAFDLFQNRGQMAGQELEDWFQAERDIDGIASAELVEKNGELELDVTLPGFNAEDIEVTVTPEEILVHAKAQRSSKREDKSDVVWSEIGSREVYRRFAVPKPIEVDRVAARMDKGVLKITAPEVVR